MNLQLLIKLAITVITVMVASELSKKPGVLGALVASLPLTSLLVLTWLYRDSGDPARVATMGMDIFWFVLGSLAFFPALAISIRAGWPVWLCFACAGLAGAAGVAAVQALLHLRQGG
ncbi:DUF3147 family protein [Solilutibacter silvestris]|uniref:DUF3147 family protein n=1 Tax=Solilutibacter silvestris TaxID=1645665 RepID=A0A2K1PZI5_9GAMM|nr:DUF3147 family protein [Lysobacter silvestris]PNS08189.1 hypothetical protein Lysil_2365 [Lysobacter silvestris]